MHNIQEHDFIPSFCNAFSIHRSDGEIIIDFLFNEPQQKNKEQKSELIKRVAFTLNGATKFCDTLRIAVSHKSNPPGEGEINKRI
jgi:hypothetical protein